MTTTNALVYVRISEDRTGAGLGVQRQEADCRDLAERLGWTVTDVLIDNDVSASKTARRPAYQELLRRLQAGEAHGLIAWHTDRLHRRPVELESFIEVVEASGVMVQTVRAGPLDLSTSSGRMVARMLGAAARYEVDRISERQKAKRLQKIKSGEFTGGRRPFGWEADGMTVREPEAIEVRRATDAVIAGASVRSIAADFVARGVLTTDGNKHTGPQVRRMLLRPRNAGLSVHHGEEAGEAKWPALVEVDAWRACRAILTDPNRTRNLGATRRLLGSGLFVCGLCGEPMLSDASRGRSSYVCSATKHVSREAEQVDDLVTRAVLRRLALPDADEVTRPVGVDVAALHIEAQGLRGRLNELGRMFGDGSIDATQLTEATALLRTRLEDVERQVGSTHTVLSQFHGRDAREVWTGLDVERRRSVVAALVTVAIHPGRKGRPHGWRPGQPYFDPSSIVIRPR